MSTSRPSLSLISIAVLAAVSAGACSEDEHTHEDPNVEACEHLAMGPPAPVTAAATSSTTAPAVSNDHKRYDVSLVDVTGGKGGYLTFAAGTAGDYIFFTSAAVSLKVTSSAMVDVAAESSSTTIAECTDVKGRYVYPLQVGTYVVGFVPGTTDKVSLVIEADHAH